MKKTDKEIKENCEKAFENHCFICKRKMEHISGLKWLCKNCELITTIEHMFRFVDEDSDKETHRMIEMS